MCIPQTHLEDKSCEAGIFTLNISQILGAIEATLQLLRAFANTDHFHALQSGLEAW